MRFLEQCDPSGQRVEATKGIGVEAILSEGQLLVIPQPYRDVTTPRRACEMSLHVILITTTPRFQITKHKGVNLSLQLINQICIWIERRCEHRPSVGLQVQNLRTKARISSQQG